MSKLRVTNDDHADAAGKHLSDAGALLEKNRFDGAGYLSGYVVECVLKSVVLHDKSFDSSIGHHDPTTLAAWHKMLSRKPYGHDLPALAAIVVGTEGAPYMPGLPFNAAVFNWRETLRYAPPGMVTEAQSRDYHACADMAYQQAIVAMRLQGLI
jgi:hypothetical protein